MIEKAAEKQSGYSVKNALKSLFTLTVMQLKEKTELGFSGNFVKSLFKVVYFVLEFALVTAVCFVLFYFCRLLGVFSLISDVPVSVVSIVFLLMLTLSVAFGTATLVKSLYLSKDNFVLLTFPAKPSIVFLSKIAVNYICELRKNFLFLIPFFTGYGIAEGFAIYYYPWLFVLFAFISLLPVLISALLSIPALFIYRIVKKFKILQALLIVLAAAAVLWVGFTLIGFIPENIDLVATWGTTYWKIQDFLDAFVRAFPITYAFTQLIVGTRAGLTVYLFTGTTALHFAVLLGTLVLLVVLCLLLSKPLFYKMASTPFEYSKKSNIKRKVNRRFPPFVSAVKKELSVNFRNNALVTLIVVLVVVQPMAIALLNKIYSAMNTRFIGNQMTIAFNLLVILLISLSSSVSVASVYSREGAAAYLNKAQPSSYFKLLLSKLVINLVVGAVGTAATAAVFSIYSSGALNPIELVLFASVVYSAFTAHLFWSAELDIMRPQSAQYATFSEQSNNPNENISTILCFAISFILFAILFLLSLEGVTLAWIKTAALTFVFAVIRIAVYAVKIKAFYKEKQ